MTEIILLAAGSSSRLGFPKQLVKINGTSLIQIMTQMALTVGNSVSVVLGANIEQIQPEITDMEAKVVFNPNWASGMASSLKAGLENLDWEKTDAVLVLLCDQVFVETSLLKQLITLFEEQKPLAVCSEYENQKGVPAVFSRQLFPQLVALSGDQGAKSIIKKYENQLLSIPFPKGNFDIDTPKDLEKIRF